VSSFLGTQCTKAIESYIVCIL